ncbi:hypothetical protein CK203_058087 [Vitis vinifera]|uniref:Secreted protein n=1 Tax=Vitis vinifera TaxID=29760 RepID=A0A438GGR7_VITVI|nr:hypothetical protein CK203_058087 [Vitis vinifera]
MLMSWMKFIDCFWFCFQGQGVVLVNTDEAGTLLVTNFRLFFLHSNISLLLHVSTKHARGEEEMGQCITVLEVVLKTRNCC